jgi:MFS family permease
MDPAELPVSPTPPAERFPPERLRSARWTTSWLFFGLGVGMATWASRVPGVKAQSELSNGALGLALLALPIGTLVAMRLAGRWAHAHGSAPVAVFGTVAFALALVLPGLAHGLTSLVVTLVVFGFAVGVAEIGMNTHSVTLEHEYRRPIVSGFHALWSTGGLVGAALGGFGAHLGWSVFAHFVVIGAVIGSITVIVAHSLLPGHVDAHRHDDVEVETPRRAAPWTRPLVLLGAIAFCSFVAEGASADWSAVYLHDVLGSSAAVAALAYTAYSFAMCVTRFAGDRLIARFGRVRLLGLGGVVASAGLFAGLATNSVALAVMGWMCLGVGLALSAPIAFAAAGSLHDVPRGIAIARVSGLGYMGMLLGPPVIGGVAEVTSLRWALLLPAVSVFGLTLFAGAARPQPD